MKTSTLILIAAAGAAGFLYWQSRRAAAVRPAAVVSTDVSVRDAAAADPYLAAVRHLREELKAIKK